MSTETKCPKCEGKGFYYETLDHLDKGGGFYTERIYCSCRERLLPVDPEPSQLSLDLDYNLELLSSFRSHMSGRSYGEEETSDAFEHFKAGFDRANTHASNRLT